MRGVVRCRVCRGSELHLDLQVLFGDGLLSGACLHSGELGCETPGQPIIENAYVGSSAHAPPHQNSPRGSPKAEFVPT